MTAAKVVKPTIHNYQVVDRESGHAETVKDVRRTFFHSGIVELLLIDETFLEYETAKIDLIKI